MFPRKKSHPDLTGTFPHIGEERGLRGLARLLGGGERRDREGIWLELGWRRWASEGQQSLFLFQLDRIGTGPERVESRGWAEAAGMGLIKKKEEGKTCARSRSITVKHMMGKVVHYLLPHSTAALSPTTQLWLTHTGGDLTLELLPIIPLRWLRFRIHLELLCKDPPIRKWGGGGGRGKSEVAAARWLKAPYWRSTKDDRELLALLIFTAAEDGVTCDWWGVFLSWWKWLERFCFVALRDERQLYPAACVAETRNGRWIMQKRRLAAVDCQVFFRKQYFDLSGLPGDGHIAAN